MGASKRHKTVSFQIGLCSNPHLQIQSWILGNDWKNNNSDASTKDRIFTTSRLCNTGVCQCEMVPRRETSLAPPCLNLGSFGSKSAMHWKKHATFLGLYSTPSDLSPETLCALTSLVWHFATSAQLWNLQSPECETTSPNWENTNMLVRPSRMPHERLVRQVLLAKPTESNPKVFQGLGGVIAYLTLLGPILVWSQHNYLKLLLTVRYSKSSYGCCPRDPHSRKSEHENEWNE